MKEWFDRLTNIGVALLELKKKVLENGKKKKCWTVFWIQKGESLKPLFGFGSLVQATRYTKVHAWLKDKTLQTLFAGNLHQVPMNLKTVIAVYHAHEKS